MKFKRKGFTVSVDVIEKFESKAKVFGLNQSAIIEKLIILFISKGFEMFEEMEEKE